MKRSCPWKSITTQRGAPSASRLMSMTCSRTSCPTMLLLLALGLERTFSVSEMTRASIGCSPAAAAMRLPPLPSCHEGELLEKVDVLLVLEKRAVERWDQFSRVALAQAFRPDVLREQELEPIQQLGGRRFLLQPGHLADLEEDAQGLLDETALDARVMHLDDAVHGLGVGELDVVEEAAAQKGVRQLLLVVRGDDDDRAPLRAHRLAGLVDVELHAVELEQEVVRELDVGLVDLVDEEHRPRLGGEGVPELAALDVVADVGDARVA